jgi:hypothetical protein
MIKWFSANNLVLNLDKMYTTKFITNSLSHSTFYIGYKEKYIEETVNNVSFGVQIDNHINWKNHIDEMISKLSEACGAVWPKLRINKINTPRLIYYV